MHAVLSLVLAPLIFACDDPTEPEMEERQILAQPSFATNINEIFQRRGCSSGFCHGAAGGQNGLTLTANAGANYQQLVGVASTWDPQIDRVIPDDADGSYVVIKLEGRQPSGQGARMPINGPPLDNIDLTNIKNWINNGAPNN